MKKNIKKNKARIFEAIVIGLIGFLIITFNKISFCHQAYQIDFDQQVFLYWDYLKSLSLIPFKDFFYPYGLLLYFKSISIQWYFVYLFVLLLISTSTFLSFRYSFKSRIKSYIFFLIHSIFIFLFVNPESYVRYGSLIVFVALLSYFAYKKTLITKFSGFILGLLIGIFFSFINDVFFYSSLIYISFTGMNVLLWRTDFSVKQILLYVLYAIVGFLIGSIPLTFYLYSNNLFSDFIFYYHSLEGFYLLGKVAFPPSLKSLENTLLIIGLILSIFSIISKYRKNKIDYKFYYLLSLILLILSLEQKNLLRSMYQQISFISAITFFILLDEFVLKIKNKLNNRIIFIFCVNVIFLIFLIIGVDRNFKFEKNVNSFSEIKISQCVDKKLKNINKESLLIHTKVVDYVKSKENARIFSFPGDPIFYVLLNQEPPFYPSIYEATPVYAQKKLIQYIKKNKVDYVILNIGNPSIQDEVPNQIRAKVLYEFIMNNYKAEVQIDNFLILKAKANNNF